MNSKYRPSGGEVSEDVGRELADMSTDSRSTCRSRVSTDRGLSIAHDNSSE